MARFVFDGEISNSQDVLDGIGDVLENGHASKNQILDARLITEEILCKLVHVTDPGEPCEIVAARYLGGFYIDITAKGRRLDLDYDNPDDFGLSILSSYREKITLKYRTRTNCIRIMVRQAFSPMYVFSVLMIFLGAMVGLWSHYYYSSSFEEGSSELGLFVIKTYLPFSDIVNSFTAPLALFSIFWLVVKYMKNWDRRDNPILFSYLFSSVVAVSIPLVILLPMAQGNVESGSDLLPEMVLDIGAIQNIFQIIPENFLSPLLTGNPLQLISMAIFCGAAVLTGNIDTSLGNLVKGLRDLFCQMFRILYAFYPLALFLVAVDVFDFSGFEALLVLPILILIVCAVLLLMLLFYAVCLLCNGIRPLRAVKCIWKDLPDIIKEGSCLDMIPYIVRMARKRYAIPYSALRSLIPLGCEANMDGTCALLSVLFYALLFGKISMPPVFLIVSVNALIVFLSVGTANQPLSCLACLSVLFGLFGADISGVSGVLIVDALLSGFLAGFNAIGTISFTLILCKKRNVLKEEILLEIGTRSVREKIKLQ